MDETPETRPGIDTLRACVAWADSRPEHEHDGMNADAILRRFRAWDPEIDPYVVALAPTDDPDYVHRLDERGEILDTREATDALLARFPMHATKGTR